MNYKKILGILSSFLLLASIIVIFSSCGDASGRMKTNAPVMMFITSINNDEPLESDVIDCSGEGCYASSDTVTIKVKVVSKDPDGKDEAPTDTSMMDVIIDKYKVEFERRDTGHNVPPTFTEKKTVYIGLDEDREFTITVVRADMKLMPPLSYLDKTNSYGYEPDTGLDAIHCAAKITVKGRTVSGRPVSAVGYLDITFSDYAN